MPRHLSDRKPKGDRAWTWIFALLGTALLVFACAPAYGPPYGDAICLAAGLSIPGVLIVVPVMAVILSAVGRRLQILKGLCIGWLVLCVIAASFAWATLDPVEDFRQQVEGSTYPTLRVWDHKQQPSFSDGSTWLFKVSLDADDRDTLFKRLRVKLIEYDPEKDAYGMLPDSRESRLKGWSDYQRPQQPPFYGSESTFIVTSAETDVLFICDERTRIQAMKRILPLTELK